MKYKQSLISEIYMEPNEVDPEPDNNGVIS